MKSHTLLSVSILVGCLLTACQWQQQDAPKPINYVEEYENRYRNEYANFRKNYPQELQLFKDALIQGYAVLPENPDENEITYNTDGKIWQQLINNGKLNALPNEMRAPSSTPPYGILIILWEEIAAETSPTPTPQNILRRKAICNLYNHELFSDSVGFPPGIDDFIHKYTLDAGIYCLPHYSEPTGMKLFDSYIRKETLSPQEIQIADWYTQEVHRMIQNEEYHADNTHRLRADYYRKIKALNCK